MALRRLPIRVYPENDEALPSWVDRYSERLAVTREDFFQAAGLYPLADRRAKPNFAIRLEEEQAECLQFATGIPAQRLHEMTLAKYSGRVLFLAKSRRAINRHYLWARGSGWRYCPECLAERPGVYKLDWRLTWAYACIKHAGLLRDVCQRCGGYPGRKPDRLRQIPKSNICRLLLPQNSEHEYCECDLSTLTPLSIPQDSPLLVAQKWIESIIKDDEAIAREVRSVLNDLKLLAGRALTLLPAERLLEWNGPSASPGIHFDTPDKAGLGKFPPSSAVATGHALSWATAILKDDEPEESVAAIRQLVEADRCRGVTHNPTDIIHSWGTPSDQLKHKLLKAVCSDLGRVDMLRYRIRNGEPRKADLDRKEIMQRSRSVPQCFWPSWTHALQLDLSIGVHTLQSALSMGVLLPGYRSRDSSLARELLSTNIDLSGVFGRMREDARRSTFLMLTVLSEFLDAHPAPINYQQRRLIPLDRLLPIPMWQAVHRRNFADQLDPSVARSFVFYRITGSLPTRPGTRSTVHLEVQKLLATTPLEVLGELDEFAKSVLRHHDISGPQVWEPPSELLQEQGLESKARADDLAPRLEQLVKYGLVEPRWIDRIGGEHLGTSGQKAPTNSLERSVHDAAIAKVPIEVIALQVERAPRTVRQYIRRLGLAEHYDNKRTLDVEWLRLKYLDERRTAPEIAVQTGMSNSTVRRRLKDCDIPMRSRGSGSRSLGLSAEQLRTLPPVIKKTIQNEHSLVRLRNFMGAVRYPTLQAAAIALKVSTAGLIGQIKRLESDLGGDLIIRARRKCPMRLTQLGRDLVRAVNGSHIEDLQPKRRQRSLES